MIYNVFTNVKKAKKVTMRVVIPHSPPPPIRGQWTDYNKNEECIKKKKKVGHD